MSSEDVMPGEVARHRDREQDGGSQVLGGKGRGSCCLTRVLFQFGKMKKFSRWMVAQQCEGTRCYWPVH